MSSRTYGQFCGFARALEVVGERWALLILRDLLVEPKRFTDLHRGLPGIPTNVLTARLKELEAAGVVRRHVLPRPQGSVVYELTDYGAELEPVILELGRWGAKALDAPRHGEIITVESLIMAMRTTFRARNARGLRASFELRSGDIAFHLRVADGALEAKPGPLPEADLHITTNPMVIKVLLSGDVAPADAIAQGLVEIQGDAALLDRFVDVFQITERATRRSYAPSATST